MSKIVIVTGASRGIGAATAKLLAASGHAVAVNYARQADAAQKLVAEIAAAGGKAFAIQADVASEADVLRLFAETEKRLGPITGLVNNAGMLETKSRVVDISRERLERVFAVNVYGTIACAREAVKRMSTAHGGNGGVIVNLSSAAAKLGAPNEYVDYAAAKGAIDSFTLGLAREVAAEGIRVNAVRPGLIVTDIHASGGDPGRIERLGKTVPIGRGGTADEVAEAIVWLLSDAASYVTGTILEVTGGR